MSFPPIWMVRTLSLLIQARLLITEVLCSDLLLSKDPIDRLITNPPYWNGYHGQEVSIDLLDLAGLDEDLVQWIEGYSNSRILVPKQTMSVPGTVEDVIFRASDSAGLTHTDKYAVSLTANTRLSKAGRKRQRGPR